MYKNLLTNVHLDIAPPGDSVTLVKGNYSYFHYLCDGLDDRGWGCGYRTVQTLCDWARRQRERSGKQAVDVPSIPQVQQRLVDCKDKENQTFVGSRDWIGTVEGMVMLDSLYDVPCKIITLNKGSELADVLPELAEHFEKFGSPVMMGGITDNASKGIVGVCLQPPSLLVVDPHVYEMPAQLTIGHLVDIGLVKWCPLESFNQDSHYNLLLPRLQAS